MKDGAGFDFRSPDSTSDGFLKKRWKIIDGKRCLLKAGSNPFMQQPFDWIDFNDLKDIEQEIRAVFDQTGDYMDEARKDAILYIK